MQFPAFWADFKSSLYVKSEVKDGEFTDSSVTICCEASVASVAAVHNLNTKER